MTNQGDAFFIVVRVGHSGTAFDFGMVAQAVANEVQALLDGSDTLAATLSTAGLTRNQVRVQIGGVHIDQGSGARVAS